MASVTVLLTTYNSNRFLREQIDSILAQRGVQLRLVARDDGSTDSTLSILDHYQAHNQLSWYSDGDNLGPARSFLRMIANAPTDSDFYALSDHDDVWLADKLQSAVSALSAYNDGKPSLYFCQTQLVDEHLRPFKKQIIIRPLLTLGEALMYLFVGGCTMVMNRPMLELIRRYQPDYLDMHDVWIYLIAQAVGAHICFDPVPHILYRQHSANFLGQGYGWVRSLRLHFRRLIVRREHVRRNMAREVLRGYSDLMPAANRELITRVADYDRSLANQLRLLFDSRLRCASLRTYVLSKLAIILRTL
ncbi:MAG: glycosyltransferase family 2 protein [Bacteroidaceae bacterium]|nr:glycosyltransferase family 2 protein [Bacteroidaceae bacterium]